MILLGKNMESKNDLDREENSDLIWDMDHLPRDPDPTWQIPKCQKDPEHGSLIQPISTTQRLLSDLTQSEEKESRNFPFLK